MALASAASPSNSLRSFLSGYMPNATISQYSYYNLTFNGSSYVVAPAANKTTFLVIGVKSGSYSLISSANVINPILQAYYTQYENLSAVSYLNSAMKKYYNNFKSDLSDCLTETGSNPPLTNNFSDAIRGCQSIPICSQAMNLYGPYSGYETESPFGAGLQNLSIEYGTLNASLNSYFSLVQGINASNAGNRLASIGAQISNISAVSTKLSVNTLLPPPSTISFSNCNAGLANKQPWYCVATGFCAPMNINSSLLTSISSAQQQLAAQIPSKAEISAYSAAAAASAGYYINQVNLKANSGPYKAFLNTTYPKYNATLAEVTALLAKSNDSNLSNSLSSLKSSFSAILSNGVNVSIATEASSFNSLLSGLLAKYASANAVFSQASAYSSNYTLSALAAELNYKNDPPKLAELAAQLQSIDLKLGAGPNATAVAAALPGLQVIGLQLNVFTPITTMGYLVKLLDGWFINGMISGSNASVPSKIASAPTYAALLSFIIGVLLLALFYLATRWRLSRRHKLRRSRSSTMAWVILFIVLFILVLIYAYVTYIYAQAATNFLPFAYFTSYLQTSKAAYVVLNGSAAYGNQSVSACASAVSSILSSKGKTVKIVEATNYSCVAGGTVSPLGVGCIDLALGAGTPVVALSATGNGIVYKGLYGEILYANGASTAGSSCLVAQLLSRK